MSLFRNNAERIFEAASDVRASGQAGSDMTILIGRDGGIRMVADSDWPLESLRLEHGAQMAYRVSQGKTVRVEGRTASERCSFEATPTARVARTLLSSGFRCAQIEMAPDRSKAIAAG